MEQPAVGTSFKIWAVDNVVYGPVELPTLISWVKDERVTAKTWVFSEKDDCWLKAATAPELRMFFSPKAEAAAAQPAGDTVGGLKPGSLRRIKIFADLTDDQLTRFLQFMDIQRVRQWTEVVKQGEYGDAMYLVLEGELRVRLMIAGKESIIVTLNAGEFFAELSLFDPGPPSASFIANQDAGLLRISASAFQKLIHAAPGLAAPCLFSMGKTLTAPIRPDNKHYRDSIHFSL